MSTNSIPPVQQWPPNRKRIIQVLTIVFVFLSMGTLAWDELVSHIALGIAIGMAIATFILVPRPGMTPRPSNATGSIPKTIMFWAMLLVGAVLIYQMIRGPVH